MCGVLLRWRWRERTGYRLTAPTIGRHRQYRVLCSVECGTTRGSHHHHHPHNLVFSSIFRRTTDLRPAQRVHRTVGRSSLLLSRADANRTHLVAAALTSRSTGTDQCRVYLTAAALVSGLGEGGLILRDLFRLDF